MKRLTLVLSLGVVFALLVVSAAGATVTAPTVDVSTYGNSLFSGWSDALTSVWPWAAASTVAAATIALVSIFIGRRRLPGAGGGRHR